MSTLDGVSVNSVKKNKFADLMDTNTELLHDGDSSTDSPSENDSFTCSGMNILNNAKFSLIARKNIRLRSLYKLLLNLKDLSGGP